MAGWVRSQASKSWALTRWNSSTDLETSAPESTTSGRYSQSHSTTVRSGAIGNIRWTMTWSGHEVDEDLRPDGDRVVAAVLGVLDAGEPAEALGAVHGESGGLLGEGRAVADVVLGGESVGELREHLGEFGVDGGAVVALHEVLDDELPVGAHVIGEALAEGESFGAVAVEGRRRRPAARRPRRSPCPRRRAARRPGTPRRSRAIRGAATVTSPRSVRSMSGIFCRLGAATSLPSRS